MATNPKKKKPTIASIVKDIRDIKDEQKKHNDGDAKNFDSMNTTLEGLATTDALQKMVLEQPTKKDFTAFQIEMRALFFDEEGEPRFATRKDMAPVIDIYRGSIFTKQFIVGAATVIGALVGIGYGLFTIVGWFSHK